MAGEETTRRTIHYKTWSERASEASPDALVPSGRIVRVSFDVIMPTSASRAEVDEWISYSVGMGSISNANPLLAHDLTARDPPLLKDTARTTDLLERRDEALSAAVRQLKRAPPKPGG